MLALEREAGEQQEKALHPPDTLYDRIKQRGFLKNTIKQELDERRRLLQQEYPEQDAKSLVFEWQHRSWEEKLYDSSIDTGCSILNLPNSDKLSAQQEG
jgi:hypothetical protein